MRIKSGNGCKVLGTMPVVQLAAAITLIIIIVVIIIILLLCPSKRISP